MCQYWKKILCDFSQLKFRFKTYCNSQQLFYQYIDKILTLNYKNESKYQAFCLQH